MTPDATADGAPENPRLDAAGDRLVAGRAADGDIAAFEVLVRRYTPMMRAYARRVLVSGADVDDVVQEAFVTAWQRLSDLEDLSAVKSWLMRIVGRKAMDRVRARRPQVPIDDIDHPVSTDASPARTVEARAGVEALSAALGELPDAQRQSWVLREMGGLSYEEVAAELGVPVTTVRGLLARARKHIIVRMEEWR
ncbi:RNA polymerase sigma-70 factor (ECF subfamily) [Microbacterium ginsengiterrae]|uniref:RNA polymerase sigma factor n=1 Tax=Microbacterium ginsengiterrae TaxID=546115 RepID=A0A7W9CC80_9MICO|nr:sigma-70 family RNA polymerase sigma factor [Microbacterium ginsengiterrae]MBB5742925.1 RNA polymerase sigma-70 factor (ECF subfamily) [Microbacterium ginsengiterrae]